MFVQRFVNGLRAVAVVAAVALVTACGGSGDDSGDSDGDANVRVVNATQTHPTLALLQGSSTKVASVAVDTASDYADISSGSPTLQVNDAGTGTSLGVISPSLSSGDDYTVVAYELGGSVRLTIMGENQSKPTSGTAVARVFNTATDAGALDVYVTAPGADVATLGTPTFVVAGTGSVTESTYVSFTPGTYKVTVTGSGTPSDVRLVIPSIALASQDVSTILLTPTVGGTLVNGAFLLQGGTYAAARNTFARVRVAAATTPGSTVTAGYGSTTFATLGATNVSSYVTVPAATPLNITVNGATVASPAALPAAGTDATLFVYGAPGAATASVVTDDNRLPASAANVKMRLANGTTGAAVPLSLLVDFSPVANNVVPGAISAGYTVVPASENMQFEVTPSPLTTQTRAVTSTGVYTVFMMGDAGAPVFRLIKDR